MLNLATVIIGSQAATKVDYQDQSVWGTDCNATDRQQSPIDLRAVDDFKYYDNTIALVLPERDPEGTPTVMNNFTKVDASDNTTVDTVESDATTELENLKLKIGETEMTFEGIHIHVGDSEHKIEAPAGKKIVGEVHAVFKEDATSKKHIYTTILEMKDTSESFGLRQATPGQNPKLCTDGTAEPVGRDALLDAILTPGDNEHYYVYTGSATTPQCESDYTFYIAKKPKNIEKKLDFTDCAKIADSFPQSQSPVTLPNGNYRALQALLDATEVFDTSVAAPQPTTTTPKPDESSPAALMATIVGAAVAFLL